MRHGRASIPLYGHSGFLSFSRAARFAVALVALLAIPLGGCSFDLGSWGCGQGKAAAPSRRSRPTISARRSVSDAQGYATRGQVLAKSGKTEEALAEFDRALALDPYNVQALYGRGLIYQGEKQHQQAIADFTAANGLTPQKVEPLLGRATSYLALDKTKEAAADLDEAVQADPNNAPAGRPAARPMSGSATRPRRPPPMAARSRSVPRTKPREAAWRASAAKDYDHGSISDYFGRTAWNIDFAADSMSSATEVRSRTDGSATSARRSSGRESGMSAGGVGRRGSCRALAA